MSAPNGQPSTFTAPIANMSSLPPLPVFNRSGRAPPINWDNPDWLQGVRRQYLLNEPNNHPHKAHLVKLRELVEDIEDRARPTSANTLSTLRVKLHDVQFIEYNHRALAHSRLLERDCRGCLARVFLGPHVDEYPPDIRADARAMAVKWAKGDFDPSPYRGLINFGRATKIDDNYAFRAKGDTFGNLDFVIGQWWPQRICMIRDGAHSSRDGGIHGKASKGAYSIVMAGSSRYDHDRDELNTIYYCGTERKPPATEETANTRALMASMRRNARGERNPVRVFRGADGKTGSNRYMPSCGYRYDGLYEVVAYEPVSPTLLRFRLERIAGQDPVRFEGVAARPTEEERLRFEPPNVRR